LIDLVPAGRLTANVHLEPTTPPGTPNPAVTPVDASVGFAAVPWAFLGVLLVIALLLALRFRRRRVRSRRT
jgi:hypothetical protein